MQPSMSTAGVQCGPVLALVLAPAIYVASWGSNEELQIMCGGAVTEAVGRSHETVFQLGLQRL